MRGSYGLRFASVYLLPLIYFVLALIFSPDSAYLEPDSGGYINFSSSRTIGYPALIWLSSTLFGDFNDVVILQLLFFVLSISFLIKKSWNLEKGWVVVFGVIVVSFLNPVFLRYHYSILSESIFFSCVSLVLTFVISIARNPKSIWNFILFGLSIGLSILVRPIAYSFLPLIPIISMLVYFIVGEPIWKRVICSCLACCIMIGIGAVAERQLYGPDRVSLLPLVIFAKGMLIEAGDAPSDSKDNVKKLWDRMEEDGSDVRRLLRDASHMNLAVDQYLRQNYEVYFQYQYGQEMIQEIVKDADVDPAKLKLSVGFSRIEANLGGYLQLSARNFMDLWGVYATSFSPFVGEGNEFLNKHRPLPFNDMKQAIPGELTARTVSWLAFPMISAAFVLSLIVLVSGFLIPFIDRDLRADLIVPITTSLMVNGNFLLIALLGVGVARYSLAMMLPIAVMALSFLIFLIKGFKCYYSIR
ncbi:MAG: hypothetical protein RIB30_17870 [Thalassospira sp.]|uniref:hypothetical protein n=1 Tax=Thalassospira sp. TaxID=1912094 RepID=UPI0032EB2BCD